VADLAYNAGRPSKSATLNVLTPIRPYRVRFVRGWLWLLDHFPGKFQPAIDLSFLSFVHWVVIRKDKLPHLDVAQPPERLKYNYVIFLSTFTGPWGPYIDAFADVLYNALDSVWFWTIGYPGARPVTGLKAHIIRNQIESDHHYSAYPGASVRDVRSALLVRKALTDLAALTDSLPPDRFAQVYDRVLIDLQNHLGSIDAVR